MARLKLREVNRADFEAVADMLEGAQLTVEADDDHSGHLFAIEDGTGWRVAAGELKVRGGVGTLQSFRTVQCHRDDGLCGLMLTEIMQLAKSKGATELRVSPFEDVDVFEELGFEQVEPEAGDRPVLQRHLS